jgi:3-oxoadipate enol-lactonase
VAEVVVDGCRLWYEVSGSRDAPPLLLSHCLGASADLWASQLDAFNKHFRVIRYDTRGHGRSAAPAGPYTLDRLGRDALAVLDAALRLPSGQAGLTRAHVCGISIGGMTALWLAINASDRVDRIVAANTAARIGTTDLWHARIDQARADGLASLAPGSMTRWFTEAFRGAHAETVSRFQRTMSSGAVEGYIGCACALRDADLRDHIGEITAPTLVITGTHDPSTPPEDGKWLAQHIENSRLLELPTAHLSNVEQPGTFTRAVSDFLSG